MLCRIGPPFASFCPKARMVLWPGLVQLFPMSLVVVFHRGSNYAVASTIF